MHMTNPANYSMISALSRAYISLLYKCHLIGKLDILGLALIAGNAELAAVSQILGPASGPGESESESFKQNCGGCALGK